MTDFGYYNIIITSFTGNDYEVWKEFWKTQ